MSDQTSIQTQILDAFAFRHATKEFDASRKIPEAEFNTILETARLSPSSFGLEPWQILVVQDHEKRALLEDVAWGANGRMNGSKGQLFTASHFVIFLAHTGQTMAHGSEYLEQHLREVKQFPAEALPGFKGAFEKFQTSDFHIETDRQITDWSARQAYIALGNMMTSAALMKIDSCPIEGFEIGPVSDILAQEFGVDTAALKPVVMAAFGYRSTPPRHPQTRRAVEDAIRWI